MKVGSWGGDSFAYLLGRNVQGRGRAGPHLGGSAGRWCAAPGSQSAAPPHPCALCPDCRSCTHKHRPAPRGAQVRLLPSEAWHLTSHLLLPHSPIQQVRGKRPAHQTPLVHPPPTPQPTTTFRACSSPRQASLRKVKDLGGGTSWMADTRFRKFTANSCAEEGGSVPAPAAPPHAVRTAPLRLGPWAPPQPSAPTL